MHYQGGSCKWFKEDWRDVKTGKCGRSGKKDKGRPYPLVDQKSSKSYIKKEAAERLTKESKMV